MRQPDILDIPYTYSRQKIQVTVINIRDVTYHQR